MKSVDLIPVFFGCLIFIYSCGREDPFTLASSFDPSQEVLTTAFSRTEGSWLRRVHLFQQASDSIPGTGSFTGLDFPLGRELFDFSRRRLVSMRPSRLELEILQLEDTGRLALSLRIAEFGFTIGQPIQLAFGRTEEEVIVAYRRGSLVRVDLINETVSVLTESAGSIDNSELVAIVRDPENARLLVVERARESGRSDSLVLASFDLSTLETSFLGSLPPTFGFLRDPVANRFLALSVPVNGTGFRLLEIKPDDRNLFSVISTGTLAMDNLSPDVFAFHTATNSCLYLGGNNSLENPTNQLYRIDAESGELNGSTMILEDYFITALHAD